MTAKVEVIAWWLPEDLKDNPALRDELKDTPWRALVASASLHLHEFYNKCHDEETGHFCTDPHHKDIQGNPQKVRIEKASPEEHKAAKAKAKAWIRIAPVPDAADVKRGRDAVIKAKRGESHGGSPEQIAQQRQNLFEEFGGTKKGYVVDAQSGIKMHWTYDLQENPNQYPVFTRGRIFTAHQGGRYILVNLLPESFPSNRARGSRTVRRENLT